MTVDAALAICFVRGDQQVFLRLKLKGDAMKTKLLDMSELLGLGAVAPEAKIARPREASKLLSKISEVPPTGQR